MQKWAGHLFDSRPTKVFRGATPELDSDIFKQVRDAVVESCMKKLDEQMTTKKTEVETKEAEASELFVKYMAAGMDDYAEGSYECAQNGIQKTCKKYLCDKGGCDREHYPTLMATYGDKALVSMRKYNYDTGDYERKCYELGYKMDGNKCEITSHKAVKITPSVMEMAEKRLGADLRMKHAEFVVKGLSDGKTTGDAETDLLDEAGCCDSGEMKKKDTHVAGDSEQLKTLLVKTLMGDFETNAELRAMIRDVATYFDKADQLDGLLGLVEAGA